MKTLALPLSEQGLIRVQGADADTFLQGQLSSDLRKLTPQLAQISSYSNAKGRMLALPHLLRLQDGTVLLELPKSMLDATLARLRLFVLRAQVKLDPVGDALQALGVIGADAAQYLRHCGLPAPETALACTHDAQSGLTVLRRLGAQPRYSLIGNAEALRALLQRLPADARSEDAAVWRRADIEAGVPVVLPQTREMFVPQMTNLDLLGGIGFDKGCYTGQEIVARLHYLGQVKRRMFVARLIGPCPEPGAAVVAEEGQAAGEIVDAVAEGGDAGLATVVLLLSHRQSSLRLKATGARIIPLHGPDD